MMSVTADEFHRLRCNINAGTYASIDISQTKAKGLSACTLTVPPKGKIRIRYYHQPFPRSDFLEREDHIKLLVDSWPNELANADSILIDSPLRFATNCGGREIDRLDCWKTDFPRYLNNEPQHAPTGEEAEAALQAALSKKQQKRKRQVKWAKSQITWILLGMALDRYLQAALHMHTREVYPTASLNALHIWRQAGIDISQWFLPEPDSFWLLHCNASAHERCSLRYLERIRSAGAQDKSTRFRKLSYWPYPDLWDAFAGAATAMLEASGLTESVKCAARAEEGEIIVPMRPNALRHRLDHMTEANSKQHASVHSAKTRRGVFSHE